MRTYEQKAFSEGFREIAGVDEVGRGPLAGPVVAAAVIFPPAFNVSGIKDSKKLSSGQREKLFGRICEAAKAVGMGMVDQDEIDRINIGQAGLRAMKMAVYCLGPQVDFLLVDGIIRIPIPIPQQTIKKGDNLSFSIAAASIIAKVIRDKIMINYHKKYSVYNFARHKGYGTEEHRETIRKFGPSRIHRKTFRGVREYLSLS